MNKCEICLCQEQGSQIKCSVCGINVHKECITNIDEENWKCDSCKYEADQTCIKRCIFCERIGDKHLFFRLYGKVWVHGSCLRCFCSFLSSKNAQVNTKNSFIQSSDNDVLRMPCSMFINRIKEHLPESLSHSVNWMNSFLQMLLPSPSYSLRLSTDHKCFQCHKFGGFMIKCCFSGCAYAFHPICYMESSVATKSMPEIIEANEIVCKLHRNRLAEAKTVQMPKVTQLPKVAKVVSQRPSFQKISKPGTEKRENTPIVKCTDSIKQQVATPIKASLPKQVATPIHASLPKQVATPIHAPLPKQEATPIHASLPKQLTTPIHAPLPKQEATPVETPVKKASEAPASDTSFLSLDSPTVINPRSSISSVEQGDEEICDICHDGYSEPGDMLVFCEKCNLPVHQSCYGIDKVPEGEWVCAVCSKNLSPSNTYCSVCHKPGGAMHHTADGKWVHLICVFYMPELTLNLSGPEVLVEGFNQISKERAALCCSICHVNGGGCAQCSYRSCATAFHPYCALKSGCILSSKEVGNTLEYVSYCMVHTEKKQGKPKSTESTPIKRRKRSQASHRKKQKSKDDNQSIPSTILQKLSVKTEESPLGCTDFWNLIEYYYVLKPKCSQLVSQLHFYSHYARSLSLAPRTETQWIPPEYQMYAKGVLLNQFAMSDDAKIIHLASDPAFSIPLCNQQNQAIRYQPANEELKRTYSTPHNVTNSSLHRSQQAFQGFDINDFADLRESYECSLNTAFITWAQQNNICASTTFRLARREDLNWLLKINTINPTFSCESDYAGTFYEKNEFVIIAERTNPVGRSIPVGMVHYYLMWYYPCTGKAREAVRAVYVCTLQRVTRETHKQFVDWYQVESEPLTGSILLSLAFLHGRDCQVTMGCCDSTDNSVSFYTDQFGMTALPRGEGRHYTPMQLDLTTFNAYNTLMSHIASSYKATLLCSIEPASSSFSIPEPVSSSLHLQFKQDQLISSSKSETLNDADVMQYIQENHPQWLTPLVQSPNTVLTELGRICHRINPSTGVYMDGNTPHFYSIPSSKPQEMSHLTIKHAVFKNQKEPARITDGKDIERELEACQNELLAVMQSDEKALAKLIQKISAMEPESENLLRLNAQCQECHDTLYKYTCEKRPDYIKAIEEDDFNDSICEVCGDGDSNLGNVILFCDGCNAAVHQDCYDITELPKGDWFCNVCEDILVHQLGVRDVLHITPQDSNETISEGGNELNDLESEISTCPILDQLHELRSKVHCCICGFSKGAMMPTMNKGQYAHVCCALWHPNCSIVNSHPLCAQPVLLPVTPKVSSGMEVEMSTSAPTKVCSGMEVEMSTSVPTKVCSGMEVEMSTSAPTKVCSGMEVESAPALSQSSDDVVLIPLKTALVPQVDVKEEQPTQQFIASEAQIPIKEAQLPAKEEQLPIKEAPTFEEYISPYARLRSHSEHNRYLIDISDLGNQRRSLMCQLCRKRGGVVPCCCSGCPRGVHASCAIKYELEMYWNNKLGKSHVPVEEVLVEKDYYIHCCLHSCGMQNTDVPRKMIEEYAPPLFCEMTTTKKKQNDEYVVPPSNPKRRTRRSDPSYEQDQGLQRMRMKRQQRKQREQNHIKKQRSQSQQNQLTFTSKPRSMNEKKARRVLEWMKTSKSSMYLFDNENNALLKIQRQIDTNELPRFGNWAGYTIENATIESLFRKCKKRNLLGSIVLCIREMYLSLLSYNYPSLNILHQGIAKAVVEDAYELTKLMYRLENPPRYHQIVNNQIPTYCVCMVADGESDEFMVGCDQCGVWYHPFCIGFSTSKFYGFLSTYNQHYIDVREETGCFFCPHCYSGENCEKMKLLTEEEVIAMGGKRIELDEGDEGDSVPERKRDAIHIETESDVKRSRIE